MNRSDLDRNAYMLCGPLAKKGYLRWWHSFVGASLSTGARRTFFVEYLILNPLSEKAKKGRLSKPSYVRISAGAFPSDMDDGFQLCAYYPIQTCKYAAKPLYFQAADNLLSENRLAGSIDVSPTEAGQTLLFSDAGSMEWHLEVHKTLACHTGITASPLFCALNALDSYWHGEGIRANYRGIVECNGESYEVQPETCFGYADKHWGRSFNQPWIQLASCRLYSEKTGKPLKHSAFALCGGQRRFLFFHFRPKFILQLTYTGEDHYYTFTDPIHKTEMKWGRKEGKTQVAWQIKAVNQDSLIKLKFRIAKSDLMPLHYDDPSAPLGEGAIEGLRAGFSGNGTIDLYRLTPNGKEWIDTLTVLDTLCEYQKIKASQA